MAECFPSSADLLTSSFLGPYARPAGSRGSGQLAAEIDVPRRQQVYITLAHWFEAAKFMPHRPDLRDSVLLSPSIAEANKFARKHQEHWRSDWKLVRMNVMVAGMAMLCLQRPELGLRNQPSKDLVAGMAPLGLPQSFVDGCMTKFEAWRSAPRIAIFGAEVAPDDIVGTRLVKIVSPLPTWTLVTTCHRRTAWRLHDWALVHYVPVAYHGTPATRQSRALVAAMVDAADQVVVFEQRRAKRFDHVIALAKASKRKMALELYDPPESGTGGQLAII